MFNKILIFTAMIFLLLSCGSQEDEEIENAILQANRLLSKRECQTAIDTLEAVGRQNANHEYLITLASAYACRAGYSELTLFTSDFPQINVSNALGGFTLFSTSDDMTSPTSSSFSDLNTALEVLYYAGGFASTSSTDSDDRRAIFGNAQGGDIDAFIMYMTMVNLGRFLRYYGNIDATGTKGGGAATHDCLLNYDTATALDTGGNIGTFLGLGTTGACVVEDDGNDELGLKNAIDVTRACQGVVLLNNFLDVLPAVLDSYTGNELAEIDSIRTTLESFTSALLLALPAEGQAIATVTSQSACESLNSTTDDYLEIYYAIRFEQLFL